MCGITHQMFGQPRDGDFCRNRPHAPIIARRSEDLTIPPTAPTPTKINVSGVWDVLLTTRPSVNEILGIRVRLSSFLPSSLRFALSLIRPRTWLSWAERFCKYHKVGLKGEKGLQLEYVHMNLNCSPIPH